MATLRHSNKNYSFLWTAFPDRLYGSKCKQSAEIIGETFDFFASHMMAYGLYPSKKKASFSKQNKDWYQAIRLHSVDSYPYLTEIPSRSDIKK